MEYDTIVIGSGVGGLAAAAALAQQKKKVLVLEQHDRFGGYIHSFRRKSWKWNIGTHHMGTLDNGDILSRLFHRITGGQVEFARLGDSLDHLKFQEFDFEMSSEPDSLREKLSREFPDQAQALKKFWKIIDRIGRKTPLLLLPKLMPRFLSGSAFFLVTLAEWKYRNRTLAQVVESLFTDGRLRDLLYYHCGKIGVMPERTSFLAYAIISDNFKKGGSYPLGSGDSIVNSLVDVIESNGGELRKNFRVNEIILKDGKAVGIRGGDDREIFSRNVVSNIGIKETVNSLLSEKQVPEKFFRKMNSYVSGFSYITLFVGFSGDIRSTGAGTRSYRILSDNPYTLEDDPNDPDWIPPFTSIMFQSLRDENVSGGDLHTCEMIVPAKYMWFEQWDASRPGKRGDDYKQLKDRLSHKLLSILNEQFPGIDAYIRYYELATPVTYRHYCRHAEGSCLGIGLTPEKFNDMDFHPESPVKNLYFSGVDMFMVGILSSFMTGIFAASRICKKNLLLNVLRKN